ncbi:hypothetical protein [Actinopolymorpha alba]|nr:hypothetical protein [Actinopolymorpha alba]
MVTPLKAAIKCPLGDFGFRQREIGFTTNLASGVLLEEMLLAAFTYE